MERRYYYKNKNGSLMNLKSPKIHPDLIEITKEEYDDLIKPTQEQVSLQEKFNKILKSNRTDY